MQRIKNEVGEVLRGPLKKDLPFTQKTHWRRDNYEYYRKGKNPREG